MACPIFGKVTDLSICSKVFNDVVYFIDARAVGGKGSFSF